MVQKVPLFFSTAIQTTLVRCNWPLLKTIWLFWLTGTYCQQREVEAITEDVESDDGKLSTSENVFYHELHYRLMLVKFSNNQRVMT